MFINCRATACTPPWNARNEIHPVPKSGNGPGAFVFQISKQEVEWLLGVLKFYPQLDSTYHHITEGAAAEIKAEQKWLEEAMAQRRCEHTGKLEKFFSSPAVSGWNRRTSFNSPSPANKWNGCSRS